MRSSSSRRGKYRDAASKLLQKLTLNSAKVVIGDLNPPKEILEGCSFRKTDVTKWLDLVDLFALAISQHGRIDVVFANVGCVIDPK